jgi:hypothetical protein
MYSECQVNQHNDLKKNGTRHYDTKHNNTQYKYTLHYDIQHNILSINILSTLILIKIYSA